MHTKQLSDGSQSLVEATFSREEDDGGNPRQLVFGYSLFASPREEYEVMVTIPIKSDAIIFHPETQIVSITDMDTCSPSIPDFTGRQALYRRGRVSPVVHGARVEVSRVQEPQVVLMTVRHCQCKHHRIYHHHHHRSL